MHNPVAIANYFVEHNKDGLSLMQLLKLSYIAHGFNLALNNTPLSKELAQAWRYGPVFPYIYHTFKYHPPGKNKRLGREIEPDPDGFTKVITSVFNDDEKYILNKVLESYSHLDGWQLSALTHAPGTPWHKCYYEGKTPGNRYLGVTIPNEDIQAHFKNKIEKVKAELKEKNNEQK